ncbi:hypothetical protein P3X46_019020 [Hevea brasiliensis]|uniref:Pentacotripeptide-repeat region of PRORP domain-containing protein n=1 Tax=Hevea brasiliensis TaxID=3981 RepID=A0ABQ9LSL6_HEVBR|nr:pentatricopeptide repeat-containing protein At2g20710, mitochondrial [Hevea brasiliensis]KAJ9170962.1 hypothetical protein P3X46_019020 [Hevea brasiliensis]
MKLHFSTKSFPRSLTVRQIYICSRVLASLFSTKAQTQPYRPSSSSPRVLALYRRIERVRDPKASVAPVLEKWVSEGNTVQKEQLQFLVRRMKCYRRFNHALEISHWMTDRRYLPLSPIDTAVRLDLINRIYGSVHAETYFKKLSDKLKTYHVYGALLIGYVQENYVQKAEAIMQEMREKGMATSSFPYNILINLYAKTGDLKKIDILVQQMETSGIPQDKYTMRNLMATCVAVSDISEMERILNQIEENPRLGLDWEVYSIAASGYLKFGSIDKALTKLRKMEGMMMTSKRKTVVFNFLLTQYAETGKKDELYRVWKTYKPLIESRDTAFGCMIASLSKLDDIEGAEKIFEEWESQCTVYNFRMLNSLLIAYCKKGLFEKAEAAVEKAAEGRTPYASTWSVLAMGYKEYNQMSKAVEMLKRALISRNGWKPNPTTLTACLNYLEAQGDAEGMEEIIKSLKRSELLTRDIYHRLVRTYIAAGKSVTEVLDQMKIHDFVADEETHKILEAKPSL